METVILDMMRISFVSLCAYMLLNFSFSKIEKIVTDHRNAVLGVETIINLIKRGEFFYDGKEWRTSKDKAK